MKNFKNVLKILAVLLFILVAGYFFFTFTELGVTNESVTYLF